MKRTLSAATSVVVGGAGAVAFPAAALAAPADQSAEEVAAQNATGAALHTAGAVHSATQTVGDVVSAPEELATGAKAQDPLAPVTGLLEKVVGTVTGLAQQQQQKSADALPDEVTGTLDSATSQVPAVDQVAGQLTGDSAPRSGLGNPLDNPLGEVNGLLGEGHSPVTGLTEALGGSDSRSLGSPGLPTDQITGDLPVEDLAPVGPTLPAEQGERSAPRSVPGTGTAQQAVDTAQHSAESVPAPAQASETDGAEQPQVGPLNGLTSEEGLVGGVTGEIPVDNPTPESVSEVPQRLTGELPVDAPKSESPLHTDAVGAVGDVVQNGPLNSLG
ncbi:hypothetical protein [Salinifilum ghardaiensis]